MSNTTIFQNDDFRVVLSSTSISQKEQETRDKEYDEYIAKLKASFKRSANKHFDKIKEEVEGDGILIKPQNYLYKDEKTGILFTEARFVNKRMPNGLIVNFDGFPAKKYIGKGFWTEGHEYYQLINNEGKIDFINNKVLLVHGTISIDPSNDYEFTINVKDYKIIK